MVSRESERARARARARERGEGREGRREEGGREGGRREGGREEGKDTGGRKREKAGREGGETFPQAPLLLLLTPAFLVRLSPHSESNESSKHRVEGGE